LAYEDDVFRQFPRIARDGDGLSQDAVKKSFFLKVFGEQISVLLLDVDTEIYRHPTRSAHP
jgi:hypothetical protein